MKDIEQHFLKELDTQLWKAADKLRSNLDAANYKHVVLGLIFLKYVSDTFEERQQELIELFQKDDDDTQQITNTFHKWQQEWSEEDNKAGFSFSGDLMAIQKHDFVLTPGRYVGAEAEVDDGIPFSEKMVTFTSQLKAKFEESDKLEGEIRKNLAGLGYEV